MIKFKDILTEAKIIDYSKASPRIIVGRKTNLIRDMQDRYVFKEDGDNIHFFNNGKHFATLFDKGTPYQLIKHDGSLDEYGWIK